MLSDAKVQAKEPSSSLSDTKLRMDEAVSQVRKRSSLVTLPPFPLEEQQTISTDQYCLPPFSDNCGRDACSEGPSPREVLVPWAGLSSVHPELILEWVS